MMYLLAVLALYLWSVEGQNLNEKNVCNFILAGYPVAYPVDVCATITTSVSAKFACLGGEGYVYEYSDASCTKISLNFSASGYVYNCAGSSSCPYFDVTTWYSENCANKANATTSPYVKNTCTPFSATNAMNSSKITCTSSSYTTNTYNNGDCSGTAQESITISSGCSLGIFGYSIKCPANPRAVLSVFSFVVVAIFHFLW